jgi:DNA-binding MarR family transcriptional regulator
MKETRQLLALMCLYHQNEDSPDIEEVLGKIGFSPGEIAYVAELLQKRKLISEDVGWFTKRHYITERGKKVIKKAAKLLSEYDE